MAAVTLALFDFDGTIISGDSFLDFVRYTRDAVALVMPLLWLAPHIAGYGLGMVSNSALKTRALTAYFSGWPEERLCQLAQEFCRNRIPPLVRPQAAAALRRHQQQGDVIYVVSAAPEPIIRPWCCQQGIGLLATQLQINQGIVSGALASRNCYGPEKEHRIRAAIDLERFSHIVAYGDTRGDREMLALADERYYNWKCAR